MLGTTAGIVVLIHAVLFLLWKIWPKTPPTAAAIIAAEVFVWSCGLATTRWSPLHALLWTSNGIIMAAVAGLAVWPPSRPLRAPPSRPSERRRADFSNWRPPLQQEEAAGMISPGGFLLPVSHSARCAGPLCSSLPA